VVPWAFVLLLFFLGCWTLLHGLRAAPAVLSTNSGPLGRPANEATLAPPPTRQAESTRKMIQRLADINKSFDPIQLSFLSQQRAQLLAPMIRSGHQCFGKDQSALQPRGDADEGGDPEAALEQFQIIENLLTSLRQPIRENGKLDSA